MTEEEKSRLVAVLRDVLAVSPDAVFYMGDYGAFDALCNRVLCDMQKEYPRLRRVFVTPYLDPKYRKLQDAKDYYDESLYPFEKHVPPRYAIAMRNRWMIDRADMIVAYISHGWGGAYRAYRYASSRAKRIVNLSGEQ